MTKQRVRTAVLLVAVVLLLIDAAVQRSWHALLVALVGACLAIIIFVGLVRGRRPNQ